MILEYEGTLLSKQEAEEAEEAYEANGDITCCYMFWFKAKNGKQMCLDATKSEHVSAFINHSCKRPNIAPELVYDENGTPRIMFRTKKALKKGDELLFDYGDRREHVLKANQWLKD